MCVCGCGVALLFSRRVLMRSAVLFLYTSCSEGGRCEMAVSASRARFWIQSFGLSCKLYFGPLCSKATSGSEKDISVMFTTPGWKFCFGGWLCTCCWIRRLILSYKVWYLILHSFWSFLSMPHCMCGHRFFQKLASFKCSW